jgi:hypothetical protein
MAVESSVCAPARASIFAFVCFGGFVSVASRGAFALLHYPGTWGVLSLHSLLHLDPHFQTERERMRRGRRRQAISVYCTRGVWQEEEEEEKHI